VVVKNVDFHEENADFSVRIFPSDFREFYFSFFLRGGWKRGGFSLDSGRVIFAKLALTHCGPERGCD
jgi:hypothetical protein